MLDISINLDHSHLWDPLYPTNNINRIVLQCMGILLGGSLTVKNEWGLLTGDEGIRNAFPTVLPNADYSYYTLKTSGFKTF